MGRRAPAQEQLKYLFTAFQPRSPAHQRILCKASLTQAMPYESEKKKVEAAVGTTLSVVLNLQPYEAKLFTCNFRHSPKEDPRSMRLQTAFDVQETFRLRDDDRTRSAGWLVLHRASERAHLHPFFFLSSCDQLGKKKGRTG